MIVDEADAMNDSEKTDLLHKIKLQKALFFARKADKMFEAKFKSMSEDEIEVMVSNNRKRRYEEKICN